MSLRHSACLACLVFSNLSSLSRQRGLLGASLVHADQATAEATGSQRAHVSKSRLFLARAQMWPPLHPVVRPEAGYASPWGHTELPGAFSASGLCVSSLVCLYGRLHQLVFSYRASLAFPGHGAFSSFCIAGLGFLMFCWGHRERCWSGVLVPSFSGLGFRVMQPS